MRGGSGGVLLVAVLVFGGCAATAERTPTGTEAGQGNGAELVVEQEWRSDLLLTEGGYSFVEVRSSSGTVVDRQTVKGYQQLTTKRNVQPGSHQVKLDVRGCVASCPERPAWQDRRLDPPAVSCGTTLDVPASGAVVVFVMTPSTADDCQATVRR